MGTIKGSKVKHVPRSEEQDAAIHQDWAEGGYSILRLMAKYHRGRITIDEIVEGVPTFHRASTRLRRPGQDQGSPVAAPAAESSPEVSFSMTPVDYVLAFEARCAEFRHIVDALTNERDAAKGALEVQQKVNQKLHAQINDLVYNAKGWQEKLGLVGKSLER